MPHLSVAGRILQNRQILADKEPFRRHIYESVTLREFFDFKIKENAFLQGDTELVDKNILLRKMSELETYQKQLEEFSDITIQSYKADWKVQRIIERTLQMMIETCIDIANHIISDRGLRPPTSYGDTFNILFENDIIDSELFQVMDKMTKFRNIVVHRYEDIDAEIVIIILKKHISDFNTFKEAILKLLKDLPGNLSSM